MIKILRFYIALIAARTAYAGIRLLNRSSGTSFAGMLALKISPDFLSYCSKYIKKKNITVTGTNGKTTTAGLIAHMLKTANQRVIHNLKGANMIQGIANTFALAILPFKRWDYSVIECDEAFLTQVYDQMKSDYLVVTNISADQTDRYGGPDATANLIKEAIAKNPDLKLILNADDPIVSKFGGKCISYGLNIADYAADVKVHDDYSELKVTARGITFDFTVHLTGRYNAYNALAAITFALENGLNQREIQTAFNTYKPFSGRTEKCTINGHPAVIQLIKNPAGTNEVLKTVDLKSNIIIAINDNYGDGRDVSWLWDTNFEELRNAEKPIIVSGIRANDMALRLKYAGVQNVIIEPSVKQAIEIASRTGKDEKITILPAYTALAEIINGGY